ncbi:MAG: PKD domain-containing protein [Verrucomicrobia bacterium]|nr:PKD domain-containing protein [Verrucomicrobiota bacterium]
MKRFELFLHGASVAALLAGGLMLWQGRRSPGPLASDASAARTAWAASPGAAPATDVNPVAAAAVSSPPARQVAAEPPPRAFAQFNTWAEKLVSASVAPTPDVWAEGEKLARTRHREIVQLIQTDPEQALALALPYRLRKAMPASFASLLEQPVSGRGEFKVIHCAPLPGREREAPPPEYEVTVGKTRYRAFTWGARLRHPSRCGIPMHGVTAHDDRGRPILALSAHSLRVVDREEAEDLMRQGIVCRGVPCALCGASPVPGREILVDTGGEYSILCRVSHAEKLDALASRALSQVWPADSSPAVAAASGAGVSWGDGTQGTKTLLYMPVLYADDPIPPESADTSQRIAAANNRFYKEGSYGTVNWLTTVTPPLQLPQAKNVYGEGIGGTGGASVLGDAIAMAASQGYPIGDYDWHYVVFRSLPQALFGGRSDGLLNGGGGALSHELGHNFGLGHANYIDTSGKNPEPKQPKGTNYPVDWDGVLGHDDVNAPVFPNKPFIVEYGDQYDVMGSGSGDFNVIFKNQLHWLGDEFIRVVRASGTNRVYAFDVPEIVDGRLYALRIRKDFDKEYWVSVRQEFPDNPWLGNGVELMWDSASLGQVLIDSTPTTSPGKNDAAVVVGRTFHDAAARLHLTPIAQGGHFTNKWVDVVVHIGPFPGNRPPTLSLTSSAERMAEGSNVVFTATVHEPDGDAVAYHWDFGDLSFGTNGPVMSKAFTNAGQYVVRCEVSDMKGGVASAHRVVVCGNPSTFTMSGRVLDINGQPLQGVRVHNGGKPPPYVPPAQEGLPPTPPPVDDSTYRYTYTDAQGYYTVGNIPPGIYTNDAFLFGYTIEPRFLNPQELTGADAAGLDYVATPLPKIGLHKRDDASESGAAPGGFTITREGDLSRDVKVAFGIGGTAVQGVDYLPLAGTIVTNWFTVTNDEVIETNFVVLTNRSGQIVMPAGVSTMDLDVTAMDNEAGLGNQSVVVTLLPATNDLHAFTVYTNVYITNFIVVGGITNTLITSNRYPEVVTNEVTIPGWELLPVGDRQRLVWFQTYPTYVLEGAEATVWIVDDDPPGLPAVSVVGLDTHAVETRGNSATLMFVRANSPLDGDLAIHYTVRGTASNGVDLVWLPGTVTIPAGEESVLCPVVAVNDWLVEGRETVTVAIAADPGYGGGGSVTIVIEDDDLPVVTIYASDSTAAKAGSNEGRVTVARAGDVSEELVVNYLVAGSALSGRDFVPLTQSVTIPAGSITADIPIVPIPNAIPGARTVTVLISDSPAYNIYSQNSATVTLRDSLPEAALSVVTATVTEGGAPGVFRIARSGPTTNALNVFFAVGGSAIEYYDYSPIGTNILIPAGAAGADVAIDATAPYNDRAYEVGDISGQKTVVLQLLPGPDYNLGSGTGGTVRFEDNESDSDLPAVGFMLGESLVREDAGRVQIFLKCSGNPATNKPVTLEWRITTGSAVPNVNYEPLADGFALLKFEHYFPPDPLPEFTRAEDTVASVTIPVFDDGVVRSNLFFDVQLFYHYALSTNYTYITNHTVVYTNMTVTPDPTNAWIGAYPAHRVHLLEAGITTVRVAAELNRAWEAGVVPGLFTLTREGPTAEALPVALGVSGTAAGGSDYVAIAPDGGLSAVTIPAGTNRVLIPVVPIDDPTEEWTETVRLTLLARPGYKVGSPSSAEVLVESEDGTVQFVSPHHAVAESAGSAEIAVQRTGDTNRWVTVDFEVSNGTAFEGVDYRGTNGTLGFAPGEVLKSFAVAVLDDPGVEPDETVNLALVNPTGGVPLGGQRTATLRLLDDDNAFEFATNMFQANENQASVAVTIRRLGPAREPVSVDFSTVDGTATHADDYVGTHVTLSFAPGETNQILRVPLVDDVVFEETESVMLKLSHPSEHTSLGTVSNALLRILDDECAFEFGAAVFSTNEYAPAVRVAVVRLGGSANPVRVDYSTADGRATSGRDYDAVSGTLRFAGDEHRLATDGSGRLEFEPGQSCHTIRIPLRDDAQLEGHEEFHLSLANLRGPETGALPGSTVYGVVTNARVMIVDNETAGSVDDTFMPSPGPNARVRCLVAQADNQVVLGGDFTEVDGIVYPRICRVQPSGIVDPFFNPGLGANSNVYAVALQADRKVVIAGAFTSLAGSNRMGVARLKANGELDPGFDPGNGPNELVRALALTTDGKVMLGGDFTLVGGSPHGRLARLRADGKLDILFTNSANNSVHALALQPDGMLLAGGAFTAVDGSPRSRLARLTTAGALDPDWSPTLDGAVNAIAVQPDGAILAGGAFTTVNGTRRPGLARLLPNGALDPAFNAGEGPNAAVHALAVHPETGAILIGGDFTAYRGVDRQHVARLLPDGTLDGSFDIGSGADAATYAVTPTPDDKVVIGGDFLTVNGLPRSHIARLHAAPLDVLAVCRLSRIGGHWTVEFQSLPGALYALLVSTNLSDWAQAASATAPGGSFSLSDPHCASSDRRFYRVAQLTP